MTFVQSRFSKKKKRTSLVSLGKNTFDTDKTHKLHEIDLDLSLLLKRNIIIVKYRIIHICTRAGIRRTQVIHKQKHRTVNLLIKFFFSF